MNKNIRAIILSFLLIAWFAINIGYVVSVQVDDEKFWISDSTETAQEWNERGISLGKSGEYKEAIECFDKAIELDPNYAYVEGVNSSVSVFVEFGSIVR